MNFGLKRIIAGLLVVLSMSTVLASCSAQSNTTQMTSQNSNSQKAQSSTVTAKGEYNTYEELNGKTIAMLNGSVLDTLILPHIPNVKFNQYNSLSDEIVALKTKKVDAVVFDSAVAMSVTAKNPDLYMLPNPIVKDAYGIALKKDSDLTTKVNKAIAELKADGTIDKIIAEWVGTDESVKQVDELNLAGENGTLRVVHDISLEPAAYIGANNKSSGYELDITVHIAKKLGMNLEFIPADFNSVIPMLQSDKADIALGSISITDERKKSIDMSESYLEGGLHLVVRTESDATSTRIPLEQATCGVMTGTTGEHLLMEKYPTTKISTYSSIVDAVIALSSGKIDYVLTQTTTAINAANTNPNLEVLEGNLDDEKAYVAVAKNNTELLNKVNSVLEKFQTDGTLDKIIAKWIRNDKNYPMEDMPVSNGENGTLRIAVSADREPMCFVKGKDIVGLDAELAVRIAYELGMKVEYQNMQFGSLIAALSSGKADLIISNMTATDERRQTVNFTEPYFDNPQVLLARKIAGGDAVGATTDAGFFENFKASFIRTFVTENRWQLILNGLYITVLLSICSAILGTVLGFCFCMIRRSKHRLLSIPMAAIIRIVQGTPIVVILMIFYYIIFGGVDISAVLVAILGFSINFGVYASEMMRSGIDAVDVGQIEAAQALGFSKVKTFSMITFPQAARHFLPVFKGEFISMVKMTSVVGYIAIQDLTKVSDIIRSRTLEAFFPLIATALIYFLTANLLTIILSRIEIKLDPKRRKRGVKGVVTE